MIIPGLASELLVFMIVLCILGYTIGVAIQQNLILLASIFALTVISCSYFVVSPLRKLCVVLLFGVLGLLQSYLYTYYLSYQQLPQLSESTPILVRGIIHSMPENTMHHSNFQFKIKEYVYAKHWHSFNRLVKLNWYGKYPKLREGESWFLLLKLRKPHGYANPGSISYQQTLLQQAIVATGYVKQSHYNQRIHVTPWYYFISKFRQRLSDQLHSDDPMFALLKALTIGKRDEITQTQWQVLRLSGTTHLLAISGMHIAFVSTCIYLMVLYGWGCFAWGCQRVPSSHVAAVAAILAAALYALLAGFSLPTQRALVMLTVFMMGYLWRRAIPSLHSVAVAWFLILFFHPFSLQSVSSILSFFAVAIILYCVIGRVRDKEISLLNKIWQKYGYLQWSITLGLVPILLWMFNQVPLLSFFNNLVAIPVVCCLVLPLSLLAAVLIGLHIDYSYYFLKLASKLLLVLFDCLQYSTHFKWFQWQHGIHSSSLLLITMVGVLLFLAPRDWPQRWLANVFLLPLFIPTSPQPLYGHAWFTLIDVGQGLSAIVQTAEHVLLFDAGPKYSGGWDAGRAIIFPLLMKRGINHIDTMIISHRDMDHRGGAQSLLQMMQIKQVLSSVPEYFTPYHSHFCHAGMNWQWDGVTFSILHPSSLEKQTTNNNSCVLQVSVGEHHVLLTGDIERKMEKELLRIYPKKVLRSEILIVPHHGSGTSSSLAFIKAVKPRYALISVGYHNRYRLPKKSIVERYLNNKSLVYQTKDSGAISFDIDPDKSLSEPKLYREDHHLFVSSRSY